MRILFLAVWCCLTGTSIAPALAAAPDTWTIVAPAALDPRLIAQLKELASRNHAEISIVASADEAARQQAKLFIELRDESVDSFLEKLKQMTTNSQPEPTRDLAQEGYILEAIYQFPLLQRIQITAAEPRGFHNALLRVSELLRGFPSRLENDLTPLAKGSAVYPGDFTERVVLADYPSFPERGVVEGFYGVPWTYQDRLDILRFEGQHAMNVYYYAPKDDPYHRKLWREPYPPDPMKGLQDLVGAARANFVDFCFAISPGLSMVYSSEEDLSALLAKLQSVARLGVSCFALFLDDVPQDLENPADQGRFKTLAAAHAHVINRLYDQLKAESPSSRLVVTPTTYSNAWGSRDYIRELGAAVNPDVAIVWTGPEVVSPEINVAQAKEWGELLRRQPLVWDNFPVNDGIAWRLNLGPLRGRDANLPNATRGLVSNPMNQARASMIPLQTIADYLWNPLAYDPDRSHRKAVVDQYGQDAPELLSALLGIYGDYWWQENVFKPLFVEERRVIDTAHIEREIARLESSLQALKHQERFQKLLNEISPFPSKTRERLSAVRADPAFRPLRGQKLQWREDYDVFYAPRLGRAPKLDGNFAKWRSRASIILNRRSQLLQGARRWKGPGNFSVRAALAWDADYLHIGVDVNDPRIYQPFRGRGVDRGDAVILTLETTFRKNFQSTRVNGDEYRLFFSPGNFAGVEPSVFSDEDYLPPRPHPRDYEQEIKTAWKKTRRGFSGDIAIPVSWFDGAFREGYEIGLGLGAQKAYPPKKAGEEVERVIFTSKRDHVFPVRFANPSSYQRLVLTGARKP